MKKKLLDIAISLIFVTTMISGCGNGARTESTSMSQSAEAVTKSTMNTTASTTGNSSTTTAIANKGKGLTIQIVPMSTASDYWNALRKGAEQAAKDFGAEYGGITINYNGPAKNGDSAGQIDIMNNAVTAKVDGILLAATDPKALLQAVDDAVKAGIPTITVDSGVDPNDADSFICTNNVDACKALGEYMAGLMNKEGKYAIVGDSYEFAAGKDRPEGFNEGMKEYPNVTYLGIQLANSDINKAASLTTNYLTANPDIKCIFATNDAAITGASNAFMQENINGKVLLCSVDVSEDIIKYMRQGMIQGTVLQSPYDMGYQGVEAILKIKKGEKVEKQVDAKTYLLTPDNLDSDEAITAIKQYLPDYIPSK